MPKRKQRNRASLRAKNKRRRKQRKLLRVNSVSVIAQANICCALRRTTNTISGDAPVITKPHVDPEVVTSIDPGTLEDSFVYVHCHVTTESEGMVARIWSTTYLVDQASATSCKLIHYENIAAAPQWTHIPSNTRYSFLLIFPGLPKSCQRFDFEERIAQPGGFTVRDIARNASDVYHLDLI